MEGELDGAVMCDVCGTKVLTEAMFDFDYLTPSGEHQTGLACAMCNAAMVREQEDRKLKSIIFHLEVANGSS